MQDEWGRHLSPDGGWVWDGTQWIPRQQVLRYEDVESWYVRKRFLHVQGKGVSATPNQMIKDKLLQLRTVVEPRLVNATFDVK